MTEKRDPQQVISNFAEHLNALRQSIPEEEQNLLDDMIAGTVFEVEAHGVTARSATRDADGVLLGVEFREPAVNEERQDDTEDVQAHALLNAGEGIITVVDAALTPGEMNLTQDEEIEDVQAHALSNAGEGIITVVDAALTPGEMNLAQDDEIEDVQAHALVQTNFVNLEFDEQKGYIAQRLKR